MAELVALVTMSDTFAARVLVARLGAEGIVSQLRGGMDGPYPVGPVVVLVEADRLDEASELLLLDELEEAGAPARRPAAPWSAWALVALAGLVLAVVVVRLFWFVV